MKRDSGVLEGCCGLLLLCLTGSWILGLATEIPTLPGVGRIDSASTANGVVTLVGGVDFPPPEPGQTYPRFFAVHYPLEFEAPPSLQVFSKRAPKESQPRVVESTTRLFRFAMAKPLPSLYPVEWIAKGRPAKAE